MQNSSGKSMNPESSKPSGLDDRLIAKLWSVMARMYGHRWTSSFGETDDGTWAKGLRGLTAEQIGHGISKILAPNSEADGWPPSLPEFRAMCVPQKVENAAMYRRHDMLALPRPKADYSKARPFIQTMKNAIHKRKDHGNES